MKKRFFILGVIVVVLVVLVVTRIYDGYGVSQGKRQTDVKWSISVCKKAPFSPEKNLTNSSLINSIETWDNQFHVNIETYAIKALIDKIDRSSETSKVDAIPASEYLDCLIISLNDKPIIGVIRIDYEPYLRVCKSVRLYEKTFEIDVKDDLNVIYLKDQELWNLVSDYVSRGAN